MDSAILLKMLFSVTGGLGIFMLGMKHMSDGLQATAGNRLRRMISLVTANRFVAVGLGTFVTCIVQSSSVTTVMCVGFVNSGFMTLNQAIGVTLGANIGTTITGWLLVLKIGKYGLPLLGVAALFYRFLKNERWRYIAMLLMGIGMIFFGLELMKNGFKPIRSMPEFESWFHMFQAENYFGVLKCALVGCILTCIVQSSSATLGITIGLASAGVIPFHSAAALVLGENIGTTITALIASVGTTTNARRAAYAHFIFNVVGVFWITLLFSPAMALLEHFYGLFGINPGLEIIKAGDTIVQATDVVLQNGHEMARVAGELVRVTREYPHVTKGIALVHSTFNIANVLIFLPFTAVLANALKRFVPDRKHKEAPHITQLDIHLIETPFIGIEQSRVEILRMGASCEKMMGKLKTILEDPDGDHDDTIRKLFHREEVLDIIQKEVVHYLTDLLAEEMPHEVVAAGTMQLRMADELESVSDYISSILKLHLRLRKEGLELPEAENKAILSLHDTVAQYMIMANEGYAQRNVDVLSKARTQGDAITHTIREARDAHLSGITAARVSPLVSVMFTNMLNSYRRVKDHLLNFAEALAGQK
ncbi:MAG: Na/Pi cotransporter family protein [Lentisphaeria bacterium]|nr:Na/Pi cotransporter family protein [Lentisphaeria bacterium]